MSEKEFDRGKCFTFFASYRKQGERIKEILGPEKALEYYEAVIDYGLYAKPIDKELLLYIGETIDSSQEKRSRAFGENMTVTRSILETVRDHPEYSQNQVAQELQISKGKVNKVLTKYRAGGYADDVDFNLVINKVEYTPDGTVVSGTGTNYNTNNKKVILKQISPYRTDFYVSPEGKYKFVTVRYKDVFYKETIHKFVIDKNWYHEEKIKKGILDLYVQCIEMNLLDLSNLKVKSVFMMLQLMVVKHNIMMVNIMKS